MASLTFLPNLSITIAPAIFTIKAITATTITITPPPPINAVRNSGAPAFSSASLIVSSVKYPTISLISWIAAVIIKTIAANEPAFLPATDLFWLISRAYKLVCLKR